MKITLNKKMVLVASCLMLVACAGEARAVVQAQKFEKPIKDNELYELCKIDLKKENFEFTPCGMYLDGFRTSTFVFLFPFIPIITQREDGQPSTYEGSGNETIDAMVELQGKYCKSEFVSTKKAAEDFISHREEKNSTESQEAMMFFWAYFLSCGNPALVFEKFSK